MLEELRRLGTTAVTILGGTVAIGQAVEDALVAEGFAVTRLAGATRIETAIAVTQAAGVGAETLIARAFASAGATDDTQAFADALAAGAWAAAAGRGLLLTQSEQLTASTAAFLRDSGIPASTVIGGSGAIADTVLAAASDAGATSRRVAGLTRFATAAELARERGFSANSPAERVIVIEGQAAPAWSAGFTAAALSRALNAPVLLLNGASVPQETATFLTTAFQPTTEGNAVTCLAAPAACQAVADLAGLGD